MAEHLPGGFGQFTREADAANAALRTAQMNEAHQEARIMNAGELNDLAELQAFGSRGRDYIDPATGRQIAGRDPATGEIHNLPGMVDYIREHQVFGETSEDRDKVANKYTQQIEEFVGQGFETTQAKLLADGTLSDNAVGIPDMTRSLIAAGEAPANARSRAEQLFTERDKRRINSVHNHAFMTDAEYYNSDAARADSKEINQELLPTQLRLNDRFAQNNQVNKYMKMDPGMTLEEAQRKAAALYDAKHTRQVKTIYENGIDSADAYNDFLKRRAPGNTAPAPKPQATAETEEAAETTEIPAVTDKSGKLAPEIDLHDLGSDGIRFTELIAQRNANGGRLPAGDFQKLRTKLNGEYPPLTEMSDAELDAEAKTFGITRAQLVTRLGKFKEAQLELKKRGLPTNEDRLPLTGDKLISMFAADSPHSRCYVGEGGLTPKMQELLIELTKNKGTGAELFRMEGFKPVLVPQTSSARRARKIEKIVSDINAERQVADYWISEDGELQPKPGTNQTGAGDILLKQFMGNREVSTNTRGRRTARWIGNKLLRLEIPEYQHPIHRG